MGYVVCKGCGSQLNIRKLKDYNEWEDESSLGCSWLCPICGYENYKEIRF